jgi:integrase
MPIRTYLIPAEITAMIDSAPNLRDKLVLSFLSDCGCRVSELLAIRIADIDLERQEVVIPHLKRGTKKQCPICGNHAGKNTKFCAKCGSDLGEVTATGIDERSRLISIGSGTTSYLREYLQGLKGKREDTLVIGLTRQMIYYIVRDAASRVGLDGKIFLNPETGKHHFVHPHDFRSALAVSWLDFAGSDATKQKALQDALGHKDFSTTMRYAKLTPKSVRDVGDEVRAKRFGRS